MSDKPSDNNEPVPPRPEEESQKPDGEKAPDDQEAFRVRVPVVEEGDVTFTGTSSNHRMSFMNADTCCSCTTF